MTALEPAPGRNILVMDLALRRTIPHETKGRRRYSEPALCRCDFPMPELFRYPFVEALGQTIDVLQPERNADLERVLQVVWSGGQILQDRRLEKGGRVLVCGAVSNGLRELGLVLGFASEVEELISGSLIRAALQNDPAVDRVERAVPHDAKVLLVILVRGVDATVVDHRHRHLAGGEQLRRLGAGLPPDNVTL